MRKTRKPDRYACEVVLEPDGKHAFVRLVEDASGEYIRRRDLGITHEDLDWLRRMSFSTLNRAEAEVHQEWWQSFLARIAALLPEKK